MLSDIDKACTTAGVWPHAVISGHAHNYQRYTRIANGYQIPFMVAGCGEPLRRFQNALRDSYFLYRSTTAHLAKLIDATRLRPVYAW